MEANTLTILLIGSFVILFSGIGILLILLHQRNKKKASESLSWPVTTGTVIESKVRVGENVFSSDDALDESQPVYSADISYAYQVNGVEYTSDRISFAGKSSYSKAEKAEVISAKYPEGSRVSVFYNPEKHQEAVLEQTAKGSGVFLIAGFVFLGIGLIALVVGGFLLL